MTVQIVSHPLSYKAHILYHNLPGLRRSGHLKQGRAPEEANKGKERALSDDAMVLDDPPRGKKQTADADDSGNDPTPRKGHTTFTVLINSPTHKCPKQRQWMSEGAQVFEAADVAEAHPAAGTVGTAEADEADEYDEADELAETVVDGQWFGTGKVWFNSYSGPSRILIVHPGQV